MISIDEAWDIMEATNDEAHSDAWDLWIEADEADDESLREDASDAQREYFIDIFNNLDEEIKQAIFHYARTDEQFKDQFECYYGEINDE